jgi:uncharacterized protein
VASKNSRRRKRAERRPPSPSQPIPAAGPRPESFDSAAVIAPGDEMQSAEEMTGGAVAKHGSGDVISGEIVDGPAQAPGDDDGIRWGLGDAVGGWAVAQIASAFAVAALIATLGVAEIAGMGSAVGQAIGQRATEVAIEVRTRFGEVPFAWQMLLQVPLWLGLIGAPVYAARRKGTSLRVDFGLWFERRDIPVGLAIGVAAQFVLVPLVYLPFRLAQGDVADVSEPARVLVDRAVGPLGVVLLLLVVGLGAPFAEELFYRGLVMRSLLRRFGRPVWAILLSAVFFALAHLQSLQFPGLVAVGVVFGVLAWRSGRLGPALFAHIGFNLTTAVVFLSGWTPPLQ